MVYNKYTTEPRGPSGRAIVGEFFSIVPALNFNTHVYDPHSRLKHIKIYLTSSDVTQNLNRFAL